MPLVSAMVGVIRSVASGTPLRHPATLAFATSRCVPVHLVQLILLIEDKRFWVHPGTDPFAWGRAVSMRIRKKGRRQGGSTIPEQVVKLRNPGVPTTVPRKLARVTESVFLSLRHKKSEILTNYLNSVYLGASVYGISPAATYYFDKSAKDLSCSESFFLAERIALPNAFRLARVRNILGRRPVLDVLGSKALELPSIYGQHFGDMAEGELANLLPGSSDSEHAC